MNFEDLNEDSYEIVDDNKVEYLLSLLRTSSLSNEIKEEVQRELETFDVTPERYYELYLYIDNSQVCRINGGFNYNETDIKRKINKEI